jgi:signal transduction histidine kinase
LRLIFDNLIDNAVRYSGAASTITVTINSRDGKHIDIQVLDNGPNFIAEDAELAFVRFKRGAQSNTAKLTSTGKSAIASGSGLGLAIVKAAAGKLGGEAIMKARVDTNTYYVLASLPLFKR